MENNGKWSTKTINVFPNVKLSRDAKFFPAKGEMGPATYLSFWHGSKGGIDIPIDIKLYGKAAEKLSGLKKGALVTVEGRDYHISANEQGRIVGRLHDAVVHTAEKPAAQEPAPLSPPDSDDGESEGMPPAFD